MTKQTRSYGFAAEMRPRIIRAALELIEKEGFAAVTAPRLAEMIGLRRPIIYYYFQDIDHILIDSVNFAYLESKDAALKRMGSKTPEEIIWDFFSIAAAPLSELIALALRSEKFRLVYADIMNDFRTIMTDAIAERHGSTGDAPVIDPASIALLIQVISTALAMERRLGLSVGHEKLKAYITEIFAVPFGFSASN